MPDVPEDLPAPQVAMVVAVADNGVIGAEGGIPWRISSDLAHFKRLTVGHTLIMGRRTHASIGRPLPGRRTIVVSSSPSVTGAEGGETAASLDEALARAGRPAFLVGGAAIYAEGMGRADTLYVTRVHATPAGDVHFPKIPEGEFALVSRVPGRRGLHDGHEFTFETYRRTPSRD